MDMSQFVVPKSDQMNADDLIAGPRTIRITRVTGTGNSDQPVAIYFEGDDGKPYKPCKSMRRVLISGWGVDAAEYVGRSMTLYRDPKVIFGGMAIGGIRISKMSDLSAPLKLALTVTKAKRAPYEVSPLRLPAGNGAGGEGSAKNGEPEQTGDTSRAASSPAAEPDHVGSEFGLPASDGGAVNLDTAAIEARYRQYCAAKDRKGLIAWLDALNEPAREFVLGRMKADKAAKE